MSIRNSIKPFATELPTPSMIDATAGGLHSVVIEPGTATIYDDGVNTICIPIWGYVGKYPGPIIEVTKGAPVSIDWQNNLKGSTSPIKVVVEEFTNGQQPIPQN